MIGYGFLDYIFLIIILEYLLCIDVYLKESDFIS